MKSEKSTTQKLVLNKRTIARLNENQFRKGYEGGLFNFISNDLNGDGCTSLRPLTQQEGPTQIQETGCH